MHARRDISLLEELGLGYRLSAINISSPAEHLCNENPARINRRSKIKECLCCRL